MPEGEFWGDFPAFWGGGKSHCILWPRAKGTANPSKQTVRIWVLTHLVQQELVLDVDSHRVPDSYSL